MSAPLSRFLLLPALLITLLFSACENIPKDLAGLEVDLVGVRSFAPQGDGSHELIVTVRCRNETVRPIGIREVTIDLTLNGVSLGKATSSRPIATQALGSNTGDITFTLTDPALIQRLGAELDRGSVSYAMTNKILISSGGQLLNSKSNTSGTVDTTNLRRNR